MDLTSEQATWWGPFAGRGRPRSIVELIRAGTLDAELAALVWVMIEARVPVIVAAGPQSAGKTTILAALLDFLPSGIRRIPLHGWVEDFAWLPEAARLGWREPASGPRERGRTAPDVSAGPAPDVSALGRLAAGRDVPGEVGESPGESPVSPASAYLLATELSPHLPVYTWGEQARIAVRATSLGYGLGATIHADSLEEVFAALSSRGVGLTEDEQSHLGIVLILRVLPPAPGARAGGDRELRRRIVAAHYVRPLARDMHGHVQRPGPAVLATWDERRDAFEHFAWGVIPELAERAGVRTGDFEVEQGRRATYLRGLLEAGVVSVDDARSAIDGYRVQPVGHRH
ncbi:MAG TPA: hypothetical protein VNF73_17235 [Candidatus Saccharimonadales bacterium]|nr:hypothetical protein [Candidatus Saccharimonadales bacterium]